MSKANPSHSHDAKTALLTRQFLKGLPTTLKLKMLEEHNPTPTLDEMVEFTQRFRALGCSTADPQLKELFTIVAGIAAKQQALEDRLKHADNSARVPSRPPTKAGSCYTCGLPCHFARECTRQRSFAPRRTVTCYTCGKLGHFASVDQRVCRTTSEGWTDSWWTSGPSCCKYN